MKLRVILALLAATVMLTGCTIDTDDDYQQLFKLDNGRHYTLLFDDPEGTTTPGSVNLESRVRESHKGYPYDSYLMTVNVPVAGDTDLGNTSLGILDVDLRTVNIRQVIVTDRPATIQFWMEHDWARSIEAMLTKIALADVVLYISADQKKAMGL